ncbi:MAG: DUF2141 domain-containing protein [Pseudomonadota bacterium]
MNKFAKAARLGLASVGALLVWLAIVPAQPARADEPAPVATLIIHVADVHAGGLVRLGLYDQVGYRTEDAKPVAFADVPAVEGETVITLRDVPPGTYAIETYQDINSNDKMDLTWLGLPLEPYGFSRDARPVLSKPQFSKVKFTLHAGEQSQILHLRSGVSVLAAK